jgi:hypothetical protein
MDNLSNNWQLINILSCGYQLLSCIITGGPAPILRSVNEVKPKKWRILTFAHAISMTSCP